MNILKCLLRIVALSILLYCLLLVLRHPNKAFYNSTTGGPFSPGNASGVVRSQILTQLHRFQEGYSRRDVSQLEPFMEGLFSKENVLILGTQPREVLTTHESATALVSSDWRTWGDCTFMVDTAHISTFGDVAWISTIGYVNFDMSRFLVLPLRLSAVMVKEGDVWKFQHMQFQFDVDLTSLLVAIVVVLAWWALSIVFLVIAAVKVVRARPGREAAT